MSWSFRNSIYLRERERERTLMLGLKKFSLRLCLVAVNYFSENKYFPEILSSGKGKYFQVFGCIMKIVVENIFMCLVLF